MGRVEGKVALITGAARGQGAAHAELLVREGAVVILADIRDDEGRELADRLGERAIYRHLDVASDDSWKSAMASILDHQGRLDVLVNNAGIAIAATLADTDVAIFERTYRVNQLGTFLGIKHAAAAMAGRGGGSIVNISSIGGLKSIPHFIAYSATKWAVRGMTRTAAIELAPQNIRVNVLFPGVIDTPMLPEALPDLDIAAFGKAQTPLGRIGTPRDVAAAVLFLASDESGFVTGAEIAVDGGATA